MFNRLTQERRRERVIDNESRANFVSDLSGGFEVTPIYGKFSFYEGQMASFGLVLTILVALRQRSTAIPALVAAYIFAAYWFTASTSFANPAVTLARSLTQSFAGIRPEDVAAFALAQFAGALLALVVERRLAPGS